MTSMLDLYSSLSDRNDSNMIGKQEIFMYNSVLYYQMNFERASKETIIIIVISIHQAIAPQAVESDGTVSILLVILS
jgi:hypothetical protein